MDKLDAFINQLGSDMKHMGELLSVQAREIRELQTVINSVANIYERISSLDSKLNHHIEHSQAHQI